MEMYVIYSVTDKSLLFLGFTKAALVHGYSGPLDL